MILPTICATSLIPTSLTALMIPIIFVTGLIPTSLTALMIPTFATDLIPTSLTALMVPTFATPLPQSLDAQARDTQFPGLSLPSHWVAFSRFS